MTNYDVFHFHSYFEMVFNEIILNNFYEQMLILILTSLPYYDL